MSVSLFSPPLQPPGIQAVHLQRNQWMDTLSQCTASSRSLCLWTTSAVHLSLSLAPSRGAVCPVACGVAPLPRVWEVLSSTSFSLGFISHTKSHTVHLLGSSLPLLVAHTGQTSRVRCAPPPKLLNGYYRPAQDRAAGGAEAETMEFFCKNSFVLSGNHQSTCLSNGSWSGRTPTCVRGWLVSRTHERSTTHTRWYTHDVSSQRLCSSTSWSPFIHVGEAVEVILIKQQLLFWFAACREPKVSELVRQSVVRPRLLSR